MKDKAYDPKRDLNPHKPARAAMWLWGERYSRSRLGSMGFWDTLTDSEKRLCRDLVRDIEEARPERRSADGVAPYEGTHG